MKLYEELSYNKEAFDQTTFDSISVEKPVSYNVEKLRKDGMAFWTDCNSVANELVLEGIKKMVPEFVPEMALSEKNK